MGWTYRKLNAQSTRSRRSSWKKLCRWLDRRHPQSIDSQLKADLDAWHIDDRIGRALADHQAGNTRSL
jgi:hypothetical protein